MNQQLIRYTTKSGHAARNEELIRAGLTARIAQVPA